jgi:DNA-binding NarL/FixJ family response regulator
MSARRARLLLADDHAVVRRGLRAILDAVDGFEVVAEAEDGAEAVALGLSHDIDLAVLDVTMPKLTGLQAARQLHEQRPDLRVLMLSVHDNEQYFFEALRAGASGYVLKSAADDDLVAACEATLRGEPFVYQGAVRALVRQYLHGGTGEDGGEGSLSPREDEVVKLIAEGRSSKEIAAVLHISEHTVDRHRANVFDKLGLRDRVALTRYAIRRGLVEP